MKKLLAPIALFAMVLGLGAGTASAQSCEEVVAQVKAEIGAVEDEAKRAEIQGLLSQAEEALQAGNQEACMTSAQKAQEALE